MVETVWLDHSDFYHVSKEINVKSLWEKMEGIHKEKIVMNKTFLIWKLVNLKYNKEMNIAKHLNGVQSLIN